jgi:hypothetical protein
VCPSPFSRSPDRKAPAGARVRPFLRFDHAPPREFDRVVRDVPGEAANCDLNIALGGLAVFRPNAIREGFSLPHPQRHSLWPLLEGAHILGLKAGQHWDPVQKYGAKNETAAQPTKIAPSSAARCAQAFHGQAHVRTPGERRVSCMLFCTKSPYVTGHAKPVACAPARDAGPWAVSCDGHKGQGVGLERGHGDGRAGRRERRDGGGER